MSEKGNVSFPPIDKKDKEEDFSEPAEKWKPKVWNSFKKNERDLKKMAPQLRSRYLAYEEPNKDAAEFQANTKKRLVDLKKQRIRATMPPGEEIVDEKDKHEKLIGQLKAAEARNRIRIMRLRYEANKAQEVNHLIACQPTARKAVRLQALIPIRSEDRSQGDALDKLSRARCEALLDDSRGLITGRT